MLKIRLVKIKILCQVIESELSLYKTTIWTSCHPKQTEIFQKNKRKRNKFIIKMIHMKLQKWMRLKKSKLRSRNWKKIGQCGQRVRRIIPTIVQLSSVTQNLLKGNQNTNPELKAPTLVAVVKECKVHPKLIEQVK